MNALSELFSEVARFAGANLVRILPFLLVSVPLTVILKRSGVSEKIRSTLNRGPVLAVFLATLFGAASPLCSCGVIPVVAALLAGGVPLAPVMAFWLASPSMDPEILALSAATLGWELAIWRLAATFAMSFGGGIAVLLLERGNLFAGGILKASIAGRYTPVSSNANAAHIGMMPTRQKSQSAPCACGKQAALRSIVKESAGTFLSLAGLMLVAFVLEALIMRYLPAESVAGALGSAKPWSIPLATLLGVPLYATNLSALGIVSGLISQGMDPAAALAFIVGGAVTTIPAMAAVFGVVKPRVFAVYLGLAVSGSLLAGYAWKLAHLG